MNISKKLGLVVAVISIMTLVIASASAAGTPGFVWQQSTGTGSKLPGTTPGQGTTSNQAYTMEQTLSDQAQEATIAFDALAFLTGQACSDTFLPPGKVADYAGFQYLRDNDATQMGHNTDF
ncbi:MAG: hypothetical protein WCK53_06310, partial [Methanomicrobiales archaeon]